MLKLNIKKTGNIWGKFRSGRGFLNNGHFQNLGIVRQMSRFFGVFVHKTPKVIFVPQINPKKIRRRRQNYPQNMVIFNFFCQFE